MSHAIVAKAGCCTDQDRLQEDGLSEIATNAATRFFVQPGATALEGAVIGGRTITAWLSTEPTDPAWDEWLQGSPLGQFQQSGMWAQAKLAENWTPARVLLTADDEIVGGFQLLWHAYRYGRIGYVSKGPVVGLEDPPLREYTYELLRKVARQLSLRALVVQPPDLDAGMPLQTPDPDFLPDFLAKANDATWLVEVGDGFEAAEQRMSSRSRQRARRSAAAGLEIREGGRSDLEEFFRLMLTTCQRQNVEPHPAKVDHLFSLWDAAAPTGNLRLYFVEADGRPIVGHLDILFGKRLTFWKKGWDLSRKQDNPNEYCVYRGIQWACENGFQICDFAAFSRAIAMALLSGRTPSAEEAQGRYMFFLRFGGKPLLLSPASLYIPNAGLRAGYRLYFRQQIRDAASDAWDLPQL